MCVVLLIVVGAWSMAMLLWGLFVVLCILTTLMYYVEIRASAGYIIALSPGFPLHMGAIIVLNPSFFYEGDMLGSFEPPHNARRVVLPEFSVIREHMYNIII